MTRPRVLIIGDSTTRHMEALLRAELVARGIDPTIDAVSGRTVRQGLAALDGHRPLYRFDLIVALLGANGLRENMRRDFAALRRMGVDTAATVQAPGRRTINRAVRAVFGADRIPWAGWADARGIRPYDGKHYRDYTPRAQYIAERIARKVGWR